jgi:hypothetical protein
MPSGPGCDEDVSRYVPEVLEQLSAADGPVSFFGPRETPYCALYWKRGTAAAGIDGTDAPRRRSDSVQREKHYLAGCSKTCQCIAQGRNVLKQIEKISVELSLAYERDNLLTTHTHMK